MLWGWRSCTRDSFPEDINAKLASPALCDPDKKGNVNGELGGEKRLNWILLLFPRSQYQYEE